MVQHTAILTMADL